MQIELYISSTLLNGSAGDHILTERGKGSKPTDLAGFLTMEAWSYSITPAAKYIFGGREFLARNLVFSGMIGSPQANRTQQKPKIMSPGLDKRKEIKFAAEFCRCPQYTKRNET